MRNDNTSIEKKRKVVLRETRYRSYRDLALFLAFGGFSLGFFKISQEPRETLQHWQGMSFIYFSTTLCGVAYAYHLWLRIIAMWKDDIAEHDQKEQASASTDAVKS